MSHPSSSMWTSDLVLTPERKVWRAVLSQTLADAKLPVWAESEDELLIEQIRARRFLRADTPEEEEGLRLVCNYAEVPFDRVVTWARKRYAPLTQQDLERVEARDAKEIEEIVRAVKCREAINRALSEFPGRLSPLLQ